MPFAEPTKRTAAFFRGGVGRGKQKRKPLEYEATLGHVYPGRGAQVGTRLPAQFATSKQTVSLQTHPSLRLPSLSQDTRAQVRRVGQRSVHFCRQGYKGQGGHLPAFFFSSTSTVNMFPTFQEEAKPLKLISSFNEESGLLPWAERDTGCSNNREP